MGVASSTWESEKAGPEVELQQAAQAHVCQAGEVHPTQELLGLPANQAQNPIFD
jgi:hypothetical protein